LQYLLKHKQSGADPSAPLCLLSGLHLPSAQAFLFHFWTAMGYSKWRFCPGSDKERGIVQH
ncbi:MAG: hypothetical protein WAU10_19965, partial [Caldilineaceae bacterium]